MSCRPVHMLVFSHMLLSLGGLCLHAGLHPPAQSLYFWWAAPMSAVSLLLLPVLFLRASTVGVAVLMNAFAVTAGVVGMAYFSLLSPPVPLTLWTLLARSTLAPVFILLAKLPLAHVILVEVQKEAP
ncbi:hypothetical protein DSLASN_45390 [Desulfoluna limicola]|uniref:Uncharacterized protein n=1 Tax=Desulfoluna limicola TaxID=2810562 RepID=A0ABM7PPB2_9BACT|nr:hypothetical protein [Desulfoluna limicola]BCS98907.1 hypothetical protein DSLASN_45390 [Desulfoluna limicola]